MLYLPLWTFFMHARRQGKVMLLLLLLLLARSGPAEAQQPTLHEQASADSHCHCCLADGFMSCDPSSLLSLYPTGPLCSSDNPT